MCQKLALWDKFIECFKLNLNQMRDKTIYYKPCRIEKFFEIIEIFNRAFNVCKGMNMSENLVADILTQNQTFITCLISDYREFSHFAILSVYQRFCPMLDNANMEKAVCNKLALNGGNLHFDDLVFVLAIYSGYYKDSDHKEFSILGKYIIYRRKSIN